MANKLNYTEEEIHVLQSMLGYKLHTNFKEFLMGSNDPDIFVCYHPVLGIIKMLESAFEDLPLMINNVNEYSILARWRLKIGK